MFKKMMSLATVAVFGLSVSACGNTDAERALSGAGIGAGAGAVGTAIVGGSVLTGAAIGAGVGAAAGALKDDMDH